MLQTDFVPYAGECQEVYRRTSPLKDWFVPMASTVNPRLARGETAQGYYIAGADGKAYGWYHRQRDPEQVLAFVNGAVAKYRQDPPKEAALPAPGIRTERNITPAPGTTVVRVFSRIRPLPPDADAMSRSIGRDHLWIYAGEIRSMAGASREKGATFPMPKSLAARLARFHLVSNVRGQPTSWGPDEVRKAGLTGTVTAVEGPLRTISFQGDFETASKDEAHGFKGKLEGQLVLDTRAGKITRFRAYAEGEGRGNHAWNRRSGGERRRGPLGPFPLVFAFTDVNDSLARTLPPSGLYYSSPEVYQQARMGAE